MPDVAKHDGEEEGEGDDRKQGGVGLAVPSNAWGGGGRGEGGGRAGQVGRREVGRAGQVGRREWGTGSEGGGSGSVVGVLEGGRFAAAAGHSQGTEQRRVSTLRIVQSRPLTVRVHDVLEGGRELGGLVVRGRRLVRDHGLEHGAHCRGGRGGGEAGGGGRGRVCRRLQEAAGRRHMLVLAWGPAAHCGGGSGSSWKSAERPMQRTCGRGAGGGRAQRVLRQRGRRGGWGAARVHVHRAGDPGRPCHARSRMQSLAAGPPARATWLPRAPRPPPPAPAAGKPGLPCVLLACHAACHCM